MKHLKKFNESSEEEFQLIDLVDYKITLTGDKIKILL